MPLGSIIGGSRAHAHNIFTCAEIRVSREIDDFRQNFGIFFAGRRAEVQLPKFHHVRPLGSPYNAIEISKLAPNNFEKLEENFFGGGGPRGPWGQKGRGLPQT